MAKANKAITLIALIITIIVLLILAGVIINMILGENGLFNKSKTSVGKYENAQEKENSALSGYEEEMDKYMGESNKTAIISNITISPTKTVLVGKTEQLIANTSPSEVDGVLIEWISDNTSIVTVDSNGIITGISEGTAGIIAQTTDNKGNIISSNSCSVSVIDIHCLTQGDTKVDYTVINNTNYEMYSGFEIDKMYDNNISNWTSYKGTDRRRKLWNILWF